MTLSCLTACLKASLSSAFLRRTTFQERLLEISTVSWPGKDIDTFGQNPTQDETMPMFDLFCDGIFFFLLSE